MFLCLLIFFLVEQKGEKSNDVLQTVLFIPKQIGLDRLVRSKLCPFSFSFMLKEYSNYALNLPILLLKNLKLPIMLPIMNLFSFTLVCLFNSLSTRSDLSMSNLLALIFAMPTHDHMIS